MSTLWKSWLLSSCKTNIMIPLCWLRFSWVIEMRFLISIYNSSLRFCCCKNILDVREVGRSFNFIILHRFLSLYTSIFWLSPFCIACTLLQFGHDTFHVGQWYWKCFILLFTIILRALKFTASSSMFCAWGRTKCIISIHRRLITVLYLLWACLNFLENLFFSELFINFIANLFFHCFISW